jgi:shikimate dehydrogenase
MDVSVKTRITGIFGNPVEHSLSPLMHNRAFDALGLDMCYLAFKILPKDLADAIKAIRVLDIVGVNITIPYKEQVIQFLDELDKEASFIGAVNTVVNSQGTLKGYNTDGRGFISSLNEAGISINGKKILIIGAGGAARAISYYLSQTAALVSLFDIEQSKAKKLTNDLKKIHRNVSLLTDMKNIGKPDIIINATPLGLKPDDPLPLNPDSVTSSMVVIDLVYKETNLLREAGKKRAKTLNGMGMLLWQGITAFELFTGQKAPVHVMRETLFSAMK